MKRITLLLSAVLIAMTGFALPPTSGDLAIVDFESSVTVTTAGGGTAEIVANTAKDDANGTDNTLKVGRASASNVWAYIDVPISFTVPASGKCYLHMYIKADVPLDIDCRPNIEGNGSGTRAINAYTGSGEWEDVVFDLGKLKSSGFVFTNVRFLYDYQAALTEGVKFAFFDEIVVNENIAPRIVDLEIPEKLDMTISTFEEEGLEWAALHGAVPTKVVNPDQTATSINATDSCLALGDPKTTYYALIDLAKDLIVPESACYLHVMAKSTASPNFTLRTMPDNALDIQPNDSLVPNNEWQDLVFNIKDNKYAGYEISALRLMLDYNEDNINNTDSLLYIDEIIINTSSTPRTNEPTQVSALDARQVAMYPNPAGDMLYIAGDDVVQVMLFNVSGQKVIEQPLSGGAVSLESLEQGIYYIQCQDAQGKMIARQSIIKK